MKIKIDENLLSEAQNFSGLQTKHETVNLALKEYVQYHKQQEVINLFGQIDYDPDYDYKKLRNR